MNKKELNLSSKGKVIQVKHDNSQLDASHSLVINCHAIQNEIPSHTLVFLGTERVLTKLLKMNKGHNKIYYSQKPFQILGTLITNTKSIFIMLFYKFI